MFENDKNIIKRFFRIDREEFVFQLSSRKISSIPKTIDNIVYIANNMFVHNEELDSITPEIIKNKLSWFTIQILRAGYPLKTKSHLFHGLLTMSLYAYCIRQGRQAP